MRVAITVTAAVWIALSLVFFLSVPGTVGMGKPLPALAELAGGGVALACAIGLLANRVWAVPPLVVLCGAAVLQIAFLAHKIVAVLRAPDGPPPTEARLWVGGIAVLTVLMSLPFVAMAVFLSWPRTRSHLRAARGQAVRSGVTGAA